MVLGKGALAFQAGRHRRFEQLGDLLQLGPGLRVVHALARIDQRSLGLEESSAADSTASADGRALRSRADGVYSSSPGTSSFHMSAGNLDEHGPGPPVRAWVNARRSAGTMAAGAFTCSRHFVTCWKLTAGVEGRLHPRVAARAIRRGSRPAARLRSTPGPRRRTRSRRLARPACRTRQPVARGTGGDRIGHVNAGAFLAYDNRPDAHGSADSIRGLSG